MQGVFKCIDFGLAFSIEEEDLHQVIILFIIITVVVIIDVVIIIIVVIVIIIVMIDMMGNLPQIQSSGYRSPEAAAWNKHKVLRLLKNWRE